MSISDAMNEARGHTERALSYIDTLNLGPIEWNAAQAIDYLSAAIGVLREASRTMRENK